MNAIGRTSSSFVILSVIFVLSIFVAGWTKEYAIIAFPFVMLVFYGGWLNVNLVFFLLLTSLVYSFEYNFSPTLGTDIPDEALMLITCFIFLAYWVYKPGTIDTTVLRHPILLLLVIQVAWILITSITSTFPLLSFKFLLAKSWYIGAFVFAPLIIFREKKFIRLSAIIVGVTIASVALVSILRHASFGFSFADTNRTVAPFFRNHVTYSSMLVCLLPLFFAFFQLSKKRNVRFGISLLILLLLAALFFSYARGAWLALLTGLIAFWLVRKKWLIYSYWCILIVTAVAVFWLKEKDRYLQYAHHYQTTIYHEDFGQHLVATYKLKDVSTAERFYRWIAGVRMIKEHTMTGFGPGTFYENYKPYGVPAFKTWVSDNKEKSTVHNYFLLLVIEQGFPGLIFFLLLLGLMLLYAERLYYRIKDPFYKVAAITIAIMLVMISTVNFLSDLIETDKIGSLFFLCLSALVMVDINSRKELKSSSYI
jgi:O-antigen ligase